MQKIILTLLITSAALTAFSQSNYFYISGVIINAATNTPMHGASVFAQNTTLGTATDQDGKFILQLPNGGYDLVVTYTGFESQSIRISNTENNINNLQFSLSPKEKLMQDVAVVSTGEVKNGWEKYGPFFLEEFIGKTANSKSCSIKNPEALKFYFSRKKNRLKVLANETILIENNALGYNIKYELDSFVHEYNSDLSIYTGSPLFEEMTDTIGINKQLWNTARQKAYYGSVLHFMRSLYQEDLESNNFEIQFLVKIKGRDSALVLKDFYGAMNLEFLDSLSQAWVTPNQTQVGIIYQKEKPDELYIKDHPEEPTDFQFSTMIFQPQKTLKIEQNGYYFEQNDIVMNGYWSWVKMADILPYDFVP
jgi:hypothetical protein